MRGSQLTETGIAASSDKQYWSGYDPPRSQHNRGVITLRRFGNDWGSDVRSNGKIFFRWNVAVCFGINSSQLLNFNIFRLGLNCPKRMNVLGDAPVMGMNARADKRTTWLKSKREGSECLCLINLYSFLSHNSCLPQHFDVSQTILLIY